jgi:diketogulonate reductase-like aldo/keto reductase
VLSSCFSNRNETKKSLGRAIRDSGVSREDPFATTKLWNHRHYPHDVELACDALLRRLGLSYVNLYLIHWPVAFKRGNANVPKHENALVELRNIDIVDLSSRLQASNDRVLTQCRLGMLWRNLVHKGKAFQQICKDRGLSL